MGLVEGKGWRKEGRKKKNNFTLGGVLFFCSYHTSYIFVFLILPQLSG